jgi:hypothetical protein
MTDEFRKELRCKLCEVKVRNNNSKLYEIITATDVDEIMSLFTTHTTTLLEKIEGELPKQTMGAPVGIYETGSECGAHADGYNAALSDVQSIINKYKEDK